MTLPNEQLGLAAAVKAERRRMVPSSLMGGHVHVTADGRSVNVWRRGDVYLARGRWNGSSFGETLGRNPLMATARLRKLLGEIEDGTYVRPSDQPAQYLPRREPRLTVRQLVNAFLTGKRAECGRQTAANYRARLRPLIDFSERGENSARWPLAGSLNVEFVTAYKSFLMTYSTSRNGRKAAPQRPLSGSQIRHCLETLRSAINWALDPMVGKLPSHLQNPLHKRMIPTKPMKDPLREEKLPRELSIRLIRAMDRWQLCHLGWSFVLPLRPDEAVGLLISDVNAEKGWLEFGYRFADCNFTKEKTKFVLPFPPEFAPILATCRQGRSAGPLLLGRRAFERHSPPAPESEGELRDHYEASLRSAGAGSIQTEHDRKVLFRRELKTRWGGACKNRLAAEFKTLVHRVAGSRGIRFYDLRHAITQAMKDAGLPHLELRYLTGHACHDILNEYSVLRPSEAMARYFEGVRPLIAAIESRAEQLGLLGQVSPD